MCAAVQLHEVWNEFYADGVKRSVNGSSFHPLPCADYAPITKMLFSGNGDLATSDNVRGA